MKILKKILLGIAVLIGLLLVVALFVKKDYAVEREVVINRSQQEVFDYIKFLKNQENYSKWATMDPNMKKSYTGTDGTVGFVSAWESDNKDVGKGEQEIIKLDNGKQVDFEIRFKKPFESTSKAFMQTAALDSAKTNVKWGFNGSVPYPMNLMKLVINMDKEIGGDLQTGLDNLKTVLEKQSPQ